MTTTTTTCESTTTRRYTTATYGWRPSSPPPLLPLLRRRLRDLVHPARSLLPGPCVVADPLAPHRPLPHHTVPRSARPPLPPSHITPPLRTTSPHVPSASRALSPAPCTSCPPCIVYVLPSLPPPSPTIPPALYRDPALTILRTVPTCHTACVPACVPVCLPYCHSVLLSCPSAVYLFFCFSQLCAFMSVCVRRACPACCPACVSLCGLFLVPFYSNSHVCRSAQVVETMTSQP
ncbi:hypothetical protein C8Q70DRAFT_309295 [Cubamyces menziesii]|nr:hypothetical protein C8Q70DRAFT_309295 [Cubamyces menziesii]